MTRSSKVLLVVAVLLVQALFFGFIGWQRDRDLATMDARYNRLAVAYEDAQQVGEEEGIDLPSLDEVTSDDPTPPVRVQGDPGPEGERGQTGPRGPQGETGAAGTGTTGRTGSPGSAGEDGTDGVQGDAGPAGTDGQAGPQGEQGPPGPEGPQGATGPGGGQGPAGPPGPMPAAIVIPDGLGGSCTATDPEADGTYECPSPP